MAMEDVVWAFTQHRPAGGNRDSFTTNGRAIYSYNERLAYWGENGMICVEYGSPGSRSSTTTARHIKILADHLSKFW